ncbi:MAG TPA: hypothetical protein VL443_18380 [Cyclobacteriaceae bacterium]|jgi:hypothetical protein|nr:hypothetical protein [Cyclobacteriaceae bacterium]
MKKILCFSFIILIVSCSKDDDSPTTISSVKLKWSKAFGGSGIDRGYAVSKTTDGGTVVVGGTTTADGDFTSNLGGYDMFVIKLDASGTKQWIKTYGGSDDEYGNSVIATADGGYAIAGGTWSTDGDVSGNHGGSDGWVIKLDASGAKQWAKTFGEEGNDEILSIITTSDGGYVIAGTSANGNTDNIWVLKLSSSSAIEWSKTFGASFWPLTHPMTITADGGYAITGYTNSINDDFSNNLGGDDMFVIKLDASGAKQWAKTFGGSDVEYGNSIIATADGGYAIVGTTWSTNGDVSGNHGGSDGWVIKLDASGTKQWDKTFGGSADDNGNSLVTTSSGQYIISGSVESADGDVTKRHGYPDGFIIALDASGNKLLAKTFGGSDGNVILQMTITANGKYIVTAGYTSSTDRDISGNHGSYDCWVMQLKF